MVCLRTICALSLVVLGFAGEPSFHEDRLHGRRAFVLENDRMRVSTLPGGGFIAEVRFKSEVKPCVSGG